MSSNQNKKLRNVDPLLKTKLQRLETQKRAALDAEDERLVGVLLRVQLRDPNSPNVGNIYRLKAYSSP